jgi:hypothetical protein|tara:strand:- start:26 stop:244 length:219 start_codon:yes stop_codon:yes gene_type:complete
MPRVIKKKDETTHIAGGDDISNHERRLRKRRANIRGRIGGVSSSGKTKNPNSIINKIRKTRIKKITRRINNQ